ncbi:MAG: hypothetical protein XD88_1791 [Methanocalculus sp. 52_23]|jgi:hypothetical protein|nr:MAG: hypothetical protein XD88_1791 [Methanocalculus sp. 52_23]
MSGEPVWYLLLRGGRYRGDTCGIQFCLSDRIRICPILVGDNHSLLQLRVNILFQSIKAHLSRCCKEYDGDQNESPQKIPGFRELLTQSSGCYALD